MSACDLKEVVNKLIPDSIDKDGDADKSAQKATTTRKSIGALMRARALLLQQSTGVKRKQQP